MKKKIRKNSLILLIILCLLVTCGCEKKKKIEIVNMDSTTNERSENPAYNINVLGSGTLNCTRSADATGGLKASFYYGVVYHDGLIDEIHSIEKVKGDNQEELDKFEEAYNTIKDKMKNLDGYKVTITRDDNSIIFDSDIDYNKLDVDKLVKIEGEKSNVYNSSGKLELKKWYKMVKTYGTTCKGV